MITAEKINRRYEPPNEPLTLDELRQMDGEPVFVCGAMPCEIFHDDFWGIVDASAERIVSHNNTVGFSDVAEYAVYRRRPEEKS